MKIFKNISPSNSRLFWIATLLTAVASAQAQTAGSTLPDAPKPSSAALENLAERDPVTLRNTPRNFLRDQEAVWTSPAHLHGSDFKFLIPVGLVSTLAFTTDHQVMSSSKLDDASLNDHSETASNGLVGGFIAAPVIIYGLGYLHHDDHATETGILGGEAIVDGLIVEEAGKIVSRRERPTVDDAKGKFFQPGVGFGSSFPSNHSMIAWSSAAVIASEYHGPLTQIAAYGLATGVSLTRVLARQHFPSDVVAGSAVGWLIGRYVYHKHHRYD